MLPLENIRILDWTIQQAGPAATMLLADLGAEVIKIETLSGGDSARAVVTIGGSSLGLPNGLPYTFEVFNRNKKSLAIDLGTPEGKEIFNGLLAVSDVMVRNISDRTTTKLGLDYESLRDSHPKLIYASCSGYGRKGPRAQSPALDPAIHAASGMMLGVGEPDMPPIHIIGAMADMSTAIMLANAIMAALLCRYQTGKGQEVHVSMLGTRLWIQSNNILYTLLQGKPRPRQSRQAAPNPLVNHYKCKDGKWLLLACFQADKYWNGLCQALGLNQLRDDPLFNNNQVRGENSQHLCTTLSDSFRSRNRDEWVSLLEKEGLIVSPVLDYSEVVEDPQVLENNMLPWYEHPELGPTRETGIPIEFSETPGSIRSPAPQLGQHTEELLVELLGYSWDDISALQTKKVIL